MEHRPVMLDEALAGLAPRAGGLYVDGTFGRGGHSAAILQALAGDGHLHALDRDPEACVAAWTRFGTEKNFSIHPRNFAELETLAHELDLLGKIDGLLLDLGVSSPQFDDPSRGFSFTHDGPLDMRMNPAAGESAAQWLARAKEGEIADVLFHFGDERASRRIAHRIVEMRATEPMVGTAQLANLIARAMPGPRQKIHPATRSFQAIRIFINGELDALSAALKASIGLLAPGGRLAVISFHSLEDRIVKRFLRDAHFGDNSVQNGRHNGWHPRPAPSKVFRVIGRFFPRAEEAAANPRARSAVLRVAERLRMSPTERES